MPRNTGRADPAGSPLGPYSCISTSPPNAAPLDCSTILIHNLKTAADGVNMRDLLDLTGKTAFVTGASSGLGAHFAQLLAKAGRSEEHTAELKSLMRISYAVTCLKKH